MPGNIFDPDQEFLVSRRLRPHWAQSGAITFVTFRTKDSIPPNVLAGWNAEKIMGEFVVMPNHVHLLASFPSPEMMRSQIASWLRYTATKINKMTGGIGHFWQQEPFDHLVRSMNQLEFLRNYIANNPRKAGLKPGEYFYSAPSRTVDNEAG